ncbi:MAG: hypothetical protein OXG41_01110 [Acidimicrobiaceae bacterium]|nr:hypothetical protein [Acidimicrobiaceae bacterium]
MSTAENEQISAKSRVPAWFRVRRWPDGHRISVLDDRWAMVWMVIMCVAFLPVVATYGAYGEWGGAGGWPTVAGAVVVGVGAWWWARRRLARVCGDGHRPRLPDGRWVHSYSDWAAAAGYLLSPLMQMLAVYAAADAVAPKLENTTTTWILVLLLVTTAALAAVAVRLRAVEASAAQ